MTYAKLIEGEIVFAPKMLDVGDNHVWNASAEEYLARGWKSVEYTEHGDAPDGYIYVPGWEETTDTIVQTWTLIEAELTADEALDILLGGDGE